MHDLDAEYESACEYMAKRGLKGVTGEALPVNLSATCVSLINADLDAFQERIRSHAYALAMERTLAKAEGKG